MALPNNPTQSEVVKVIKDLETNKADDSSLSLYYPKSGGALNSGAVILLTGGNPYVGIKETNGTQFYLQGYKGEIGISVSGNWGTKRISLDANGKVFIPSKTLGDGTYTYTLPNKTGTVAMTSDIPSLSGYLQGSKYNADNPSTFIGYTAEENVNSGYQVAFRNNNDANGICWSKFANKTNEALAPSACTYNGFFYVTSATASLSGADSNPFTASGLHTGSNDFRILTTAYSDQWLQQIATDFRSDYVFIRRRENGTWQDWVKVAPGGSGTITGVQLNGTSIASSGTANVQALPNFSLNINHGTAGNPRQVKFLTVNYASAATYFKMSATSCHDNGTSYQFLEDIIIGCTTGGTVVCNVYKYCQQAVTLDNVARNYGDVFYVIDTTNKKVDFFILCGQYASSQFTPATKIGNTTIAYITQYTGTATYYSSGTKVWASGNSTTYARLSDIPTSYVSSVNGQTGAVTVPSMPFTLTLVGTYTTVTAVNTIMTDTSWYLFVPYGTSVYQNMKIYTAATGGANFQNGVPFFAHREPHLDYFYVGTLGATNSSAQQVATVYRVSYCKVYKVTF